MNLPPLRTVRTVAQSATAVPAPALVTPAAGPSAAPLAPGTPLATAFTSQPDPIPHAPGLTPQTRALLRELFELKLIDLPAVGSFLASAAPKLSGLNTRERAALAVAHAGLITPYQRDRVLGGQSFGLVFGPYRVLDRLGVGSVGVVFLGEHSLLRRRVAIKVLPVDDSISTDLVERFRTETRALAALDHPHVVGAFDAGVLPSPGGSQPDLHYLVLELVPGGDLENYVYANGALPVPRACEWGRQAAAGLQAAHDRHLIHRDLKPSNLLLTADLQVKIVDFGLVRELASSITRPGRLVGSVDFMAPEQSRDATTVGPAADVYGLGATLFWAMTGQLPVPRGESVAETLKAVAAGKTRRLRELLPDAPSGLDHLLARMLALDASKRPSAVEVMQGLALFAGDASEDPGAEVVRLTDTVRQLEADLRARGDDVRKTQGAVLFTLAKLAGTHDGETDGHLRRMQEYVRILAERLRRNPEWPTLAAPGYIDTLVRCVPLHDVGKVGVPDAVMSKPGPLDPAEMELVRGHPAAGAELIESLAREHPEALVCLPTARAVVRHHHERWDGTGYPDGLKGSAIPPAARLVALADVYDSMRRDRPQRPGMPHAQAALAIISAQGQFDPAVLAAFQATEARFDDVWETIPG